MLLVPHYLVNCLPEVHASALQLYLYERESIAEDSHIVPVRVLADYSSLVSDLPDILGMVFIDEADIYLAVVITLKDILISQNFCRLEDRTSEHVIKEPIPFFVRKRNAPQFFSVEVIELLPEVGKQAIIILDGNRLVSLFVQLFDQLVFQFGFALVSHSHNPLFFRLIGNYLFIIALLVFQYKKDRETLVSWSSFYPIWFFHIIFIPSCLNSSSHHCPASNTCASPSYTFFQYISRLLKGFSISSFTKKMQSSICF